MTQRLSADCPVRAMRIGKSDSVTDIHLIFTGKRRRTMRFRFIDQAGRSTDLQMSRHMALDLAEWAMAQAITPSSKSGVSLRDV